MKRMMLVCIAVMVGWVAGAPTLRSRRDERGLSQSTENAILLAGAVSVAIIVIAAVTVYVKTHMPK